MHPSQYPFPVSSGGLRAAAAVRPLRSPPANTPQGALQAGSVRQRDLGYPPAVFGLGGFGTGAGAMVRAHGQDADVSAGIVVIFCGPNPGTAGTVQLQFPAASGPPQAYWVTAEWSGLITPVLAGQIVQCNWTASRPLLPRETLLMAYQWWQSQ